MNKTNQLKQEWRKERAKDTIREMNLDEQRLNEVIKRRRIRNDRKDNCG